MLLCSSIFRCGAPVGSFHHSLTSRMVTRATVIVAGCDPVTVGHCNRLTIVLGVRYDTGSSLLSTTLSSPLASHSVMESSPVSRILSCLSCQSCQSFHNHLKCISHERCDFTWVFVGVSSASDDLHRLRPMTQSQLGFYRRAETLTIQHN